MLHVLGHQRLPVLNGVVRGWLGVYGPLASSCEAASSRVRCLVGGPFRPRRNHNQTFVCQKMVTRCACELWTGVSLSLSLVRFEKTCTITLVRSNPLLMIRGTAVAWSDIWSGLHLDFGTLCVTSWASIYLDHCAVVFRSGVG